MNLGIKHLSKSITPKTAGILWLTDEGLNFKTPGVYEFNYLLNGVIIESLTKAKENNLPQESQNFFLSDNFESKFFIAHLVIDQKQDIKKMFELLKLAKSLLSNEPQILIFNRSKNTANVNVLKELSQKSPDIIFENLNI